MRGINRHGVRSSLRDSYREIGIYILGNNRIPNHPEVSLRLFMGKGECIVGRVSHGAEREGFS